MESNYFTISRHFLIFAAFLYKAANMRTQSPAILELAWPQLQLVHMSGTALEQGMERVDVNGITVPVFCSAKTVADCFKYRNKIGLDVALEALREAVLGKRVERDQL